MGISYAVARRLAEAGASVLLGDVAETERPAKMLSAETGRTVLGAHLDVGDATAIAPIERAEREFGGLDIWVDNAGPYRARRC
jgi:NAD(P)-dependent dehydrogenase (short-subunit alcohol dehydrogenase family)